MCAITVNVYSSCCSRFNNISNGFLPASQPASQANASGGGVASRNMIRVGLEGDGDREVSDPNP